MKAPARLLLLLGLLWGTAAEARSSLSAAELHEHAAAVAALRRGAPTEAIAQLELLADRGVVQPDVSYDRGLAYLTRAQSRASQPGDYGRAAAALQEALRLRPSDEGAQAALARVQEDLARARGRRGNTSLMARPSLLRAVLDFLPESLVAGLALAASLATTLGLALALFVRSVRRRFLGRWVTLLAGALGLLLGTWAWAARQQRHATREAVVIASEARLRDAAGIPLRGKELGGGDGLLPEGALLVILEETERFFLVEWGAKRYRVQRDEVRLLARD